MKAMMLNLVRLVVHIAVLRPFCRLVFGVNMHGVENVPKDRPFVIVANHNSHLDVLLLFLIIPVLRISSTHVVAASEYFKKNRSLYFFVNFLFQPVWVDREKKSGNPVATMGDLLDKGQSIILFPEGSRGEPGEVGKFHSGVGRLLQNREQVPVVPVYLLGPERVLPRRIACPLPLWNQVFIGVAKHSTGDPLELTNSLRDSVLKMAQVATTKRHRRLKRRGRTFTVAVLGIDGSGKSTVTEHLTRQTSRNGTTCLIGDNLDVFHHGATRDELPLLREKIRKQISHHAKQAKSLKSYKIPKLAELIMRDKLQLEAKRWYRPNVVFMDGSPLINLTAWSTLYSKDEMRQEFCKEAMEILSGRPNTLAKESQVLGLYPELSTLRRLGLTNLEIPDAVLFLDVEPATSVARIEKRGDAKQVHETEEKLARLRQAYKIAVQVAARDFKVPSIIINAERSFDEVLAESQGFVNNEIGACHE